MPWKDKFQKLRNEFEGMISPGQPQPQQQYPPQQYQQYPPQQQYQQYAPQQQQHFPGHQQYYAPPPGHDAPPPVPPHPFQNDQGPPVPPHPPQVFWQPKFAPDVPVTEEWDAKLGNADGWGNQELQFYTAEQQNAFQ